MTEAPCTPPPPARIVPAVPPAASRRGTSPESGTVPGCSPAPPPPARRAPRGSRSPSPPTPLAGRARRSASVPAGEGEKGVGSWIKSPPDPFYLLSIAPIGAQWAHISPPLRLPRRPRWMVHSAFARVPGTSRCVMSKHPSAQPWPAADWRRLRPACRGRRRPCEDGKTGAAHAVGRRVCARPEKPYPPMTYDAPNDVPFGALPLPMGAGRRRSPRRTRGAPAAACTGALHNTAI